MPTRHLARIITPLQDAVAKMASAGGQSSFPSPRDEPPAHLFDHGTCAQWNADQIARAERHALFNMECG